MNQPPGKKRRLTDDWGDDDDFDQILTQHANLAQIDHLIESSQQTLNVADLKLKSGAKSSEVYKPKTCSYQRSNSLGSSVTIRKNLENKIEKAKKDKELEQLMFSKDGEIKNLKMRLTTVQKDLNCQRLEASEQFKRKLSSCEDEKNKLQHQIQLLKTEIEFKDHELNKQKFVSSTPQSTIKPLTPTLSSSSNILQYKSSSNKKIKTLPNFHSVGFNMSESFSKVPSRNQECQTKSLGISFKTYRTPFKLLSEPSNTDLMSSSQTIISMSQLHHSFNNQQKHLAIVPSFEVVEGDDNTSIFSMLQGLNANNRLHNNDHIDNFLNNKNINNNNINKINNNMIVSSGKGNLGQNNVELMNFMDSINRKMLSFKSLLSQSTFPLYSHHPFHQPIIYSDFFNYQYHKFYQQLESFLKEDKEIQNSKNKLGDIEKRKYNNNHIINNVNNNLNYKRNPINYLESLKNNQNKNQEELTNNKNNDLLFGLSRDLTYLRNLLMLYKQHNADMDESHIHTTSNFLFDCLNKKECLHYPQIFLTSLDLLSCLIQQPSLHSPIKDLFRNGLLINVLKPHKKTHNNNKKTPNKKTPNNNKPANNDDSNNPINHSSIDSSKRSYNTFHNNPNNNSNNNITNTNISNNNPNNNENNNSNINITNTNISNNNPKNNENNKPNNNNDAYETFMQLHLNTRQALYYRFMMLLRAMGSVQELFHVLCCGDDDTCLLPSICDLCCQIRSHHANSLSFMFDRHLLSIIGHVISSITKSYSSSKINSSSTSTISLSSSSSSSSSSSLTMQSCQCFFKLSNEVFLIIENNIEKLIDLQNNTNYNAYNNENNNKRLIKEYSYDSEYTNGHKNSIDINTTTNHHTTPSINNNQPSNHFNIDLTTTNPVFSNENNSNTNINPNVNTNTNNSNTNNSNKASMNKVQKMLFTNIIQAELLLQNFTALQSISDHFKQAFTTSLVMHVHVMKSFRSFLSTHSVFFSENEYSELLDVVTCHLNQVNPDDISL